MRPLSLLTLAFYGVIATRRSSALQLDGVSKEDTAAAGQCNR